MTDQPNYPSEPVFQPVGSPPVGNPNPPLADSVVVPAIESSSGPAHHGRSFLTRIGAAVGAVALVAGGGYVALSVGSASGGASSPEAAVSEMFGALSNEDFVGAAAYIEPAERETMVDAGFELIDELKRLEVFSDDLDMGNLAGLDLEFNNLELTSETVFEGVAKVDLIGGEASFEIDYAALPYGDVILDLAEGDIPQGTESATDSMADADLQLVTVERGGRWYVSYMYTAAEVIREGLDMPVPDPALRPSAIGADTPGEAVEAMARELVDLNPSGVIGMLDPEEMAVIYDYAPLFLPELQNAADGLKNDAAEEGVTWSLDRLDTSADTDGDTATVFVNGFAASAEFPQGYGEIDVNRDGGTARFEYDEGDGGDSIAASGSFADDCFQAEASENNETVFAEEFCTDELGEEFGSAMDEFSGIDVLDGVGIEVHEVDGRWFVSPTRSYTEAMLAMIRSVEPDDIDSFFDGFGGVYEDALGGFSELQEMTDNAILGSTDDFSLPDSEFGSIDDDLYEFDDDFYEFDEEADLGNEDFGEESYEWTESENSDLLAPTSTSGFALDLNDSSEWTSEIGWLFDTDSAGAGLVRGVSDYASAESGDARVVVVEFDSIESATDEFNQIVAIAEGTPVSESGADVLTAQDFFEEPVKIFRVNDKMGLVSTYGMSEADLNAIVADLVAHLAG